MTSKQRSLTIGLAALVLGSTPLAAQNSLAATVAAQRAAAKAITELSQGCWACSVSIHALVLCVGGQVPGYWNCSYTWAGTCMGSSSGCGAGASLPVDPDGSTQYVSRAPAAGVFASTSGDQPDLVRNCEGVVVARLQSPDEIEAFRARTASLTL
jgi:hypothetical protein